MNEKIKVAYVCHISNDSIRKALPLISEKIENVIRKILGQQPYHYRNYAIWNTLLCENAQYLKNIELHIISPHVKMLCREKNFEINGVYYHIFRDQSSTFLGKFVYPRKDVLQRYITNAKNVERIINRINPDLINMIGAEGPFVNSYGLLADPQVRPFILTLQTVMSDPDYLKNYPISEKDYLERTRFEKAIIKKIHYISHDSFWYRELARKINASATFVRYTYLLPSYNIDTHIKKEFDFVYYAANIAKAGRDAVEAFVRAYKQNPNITLNIVGAYSPTTYKELNDILKKEGCENKVVFSGFFPSHQDALKQVVKSRFSLVPIKVDLISGTILESIKLGLPVITYITKGTPNMNKNKQSVLLSEISDYDSLASNMIKLIDNPDLARELNKNALSYVDGIWNNRRAVERLSDVYRAVYDNFYQKKEIPITLKEAVY